MRLNEVAGEQPDIMIYVDMDGVIANFVAGVTKIMDKPYSERRYRTDPKYRSMMWKTVGAYAKQGGKLWRELPKMDDADMLWNFVKDYPHEILSATGNPGYGAEQQKHEWIREHFGNVKVNLVRKSSEKAQFATPNSILIDDQPKSIDPWRAAGGIGILHKNAGKTISDLKKIIERMGNK